MRRIFAFAVFIILASATLAVAQATSTTRLIPYASTALDGNGAPLAGETTLTLELFEEQEGGAPLWRETQRVRVDGRGRYLVYLGAVTPIPQIAFSEERARWLAVSIGNRPQPRVMLVAVPYALRAADADTLGGQPASAFVRSRADGRLETSAGVVAEAAVEGSGVPGQLAKFSSPTTLSSSVISESATNRVGVGLPDPTGGGVVDSVFTIRNFDNNTGFAVLNQTQQRRFALNTLASGAWTMYDGAAGTWNQGLTQIGGKVGIGVTAPTARLQVLQTAPGFAPPAGAFEVNNTASVAPAVQGTVNSAHSNTTGAGIYGVSTGVGGHAGAFESTNASHFTTTVYVSQAGTGPALTVNHAGATGNIALFLDAGSSVARIDKTGRGFFDGGTQVGGADIAESFEVEAATHPYEPGDVLEISVAHDRRLQRSTESYSTRVVGVYATKPGVLLTDPTIDAEPPGRVPLGVVGVIPTKVSGENGAIRRGDLLVSAGTAGHAMKSGPQPPVGSVIGKALADFAAPGTGVIEVFVNAR